MITKIRIKNFGSIKDEEITSKSVSDWNVFIIGYVQSVMVYKHIIKMWRRLLVKMNLESQHY